MKNEPIELLTQPKWRIIDQSSLGLYVDPKQSFAMDDTLCASVGKGLSPATARSWVHHNTIVLGIQDTRLPFLQDGVKLLEEEGYRVIVRNSGGLAVVLDEGVLNVSLIFAEQKKALILTAGMMRWWNWSAGCCLSMRWTLKLMKLSALIVRAAMT